MTNLGGNMSPPTPTVGQPITCRAAVIWAPGEKYKIEEVVVAAPRENQVRVKVLYCSICHSDVTLSRMQQLASEFPAVFGHESAGIVESVGEGVTDVQVGDTVLPCIVGQCRAQTCPCCKEDKSNSCPLRPTPALSSKIPGDDEPHFTTKDGKVLGRVLGISSFSEYTVVHKDNVAKIDPTAPLDKVCVLSCGLATVQTTLVQSMNGKPVVMKVGLGAAWNVAKVKRGSTVAVFGLGAVGLAVAEGCRVAGASRIIGVDTNPSKVNQGKLFGVTDFINAKDLDKPISEVIVELTEGGVDYSFECVGSVEVLKDAVECSREQWGVTVVAGLQDLETNFVIRPNAFLAGRSLLGTAIGGFRVCDLAHLVERSMAKEFELDAFITHILPMSQINDGIDLLLSGRALRCVLDVNK